MSRLKKDIGDLGEDLACKFLERHGFRIVERNYHTTHGEIDIVAVKGGDFYFVEVKTRRIREFANDQAITYFKKKRLEKAMRHYCYHRNVADVSLMMAGVIVTLNSWTKKAGLRFVVLYPCA